MPINVSEYIQKEHRQRIRFDFLSRENGHDFNEYINGGFRTASWNIICGNSGGGKSYLMINTFIDLLKQKKKVKFYSTELSEQAMLDRIVSVYTGLPESYVEQAENKLNNTEVFKCLKWLEDYQNNIECVNTIETIVDDVDKFVGDNGNDTIILIDHIHALTTEVSHLQKENDRTSYYLKRFEENWKRGVTFIVAAQFRKEATNSKMRTYEDIKGMSEIFYLASLILYVFVSETQQKYNSSLGYGDNPQSTLLIMKARDGSKYPRQHCLEYETATGRTLYNKPIYGETNEKE